MSPTALAAQPDFTVCVLLYGDYPDLALRCLSGLRGLVTANLISLRIGLNAVSSRTKDTVAALGLEGAISCQSPENIKKYPMMRRLFGLSDDGAAPAIISPFVMWFDDDSYISAETPAGWLDAVSRTMGSADLIGSTYNISLKGNQARWIRDQPWYSGVSVPEGHRVSYCTGGWWTVRTDVLRRFDWPLRELLHRGGDVMLGELCRQQGLRIVHFRDGVGINADEHGQESKSPRRGYDSQPIGWDYEPPEPPCALNAVVREGTSAHAVRSRG